MQPTHARKTLLTSSAAATPLVASPHPSSRRGSHVEACHVARGGGGDVARGGGGDGLSRDGHDSDGGGGGTGGVDERDVQCGVRDPECERRIMSRYPQVSRQDKFMLKATTFCTPKMLPADSQKERESARERQSNGAMLHGASTQTRSGASTQTRSALNLSLLVHILTRHLPIKVTL